MRDTIAAYVKKVRELGEYCRGNEEATKKSLIEPLFTCLGYDVADPRECLPEHKEDFGKYKSTKPVDYAFFKDGAPIFFVEAKHVDKKLAGYDEQLGAYFAKAPGVKLGILTNGVHWRFYTDLENQHIMDKKPFLEWRVLSDDPPPYDFLLLLQKAKYDAGNLRTFAQGRRQQNLLLDELSRLLEPAPEFIKLAIANIETRNLKESVVDSWKPVLKAAIAEWAKQQRLSSVLSEATEGPKKEEGPRAPKMVETTQAELEGFALVQRLLGPERPVEYEDMLHWFKIHVAGKRSRTVCRLRNFGEKQPSVWVPLAVEQVSELAPSLQVTAQGKNRARISLNDCGGLELMAPVLQAAWDARSGSFFLGAEEEEDDEG
jgi:hypothetical protein